jgi:RNA polymerase sigma-70 factor (ECF subfamily)
MGVKSRLRQVAQAGGRMDEQRETDDARSADKAEWIRGALDAHEGALIAYARRMLSDGEKARDVVQDSFLRLCRQEPANVGDVRRWLFTVCRNRALDELRRRKHVETTAEAKVMNGKADHGPAPDVVVEERDAAQAAIDALGTLPPKEREVIHLKFREGMSYREISAVTGHSLSHVGVLIHTGMKRLRGRLAPAFGVGAAHRGAAR